jgi:hypothetical protein
MRSCWNISLPWSQVSVRRKTAGRPCEDGDQGVADDLGRVAAADRHQNGVSGLTVDEGRQR